MAGDNVLVIGSGGREHAIAWKLAQSPHVYRVYLAPGNAGTHNETKCENVALDGSQANFPNLSDFVRESKIGMVVVGPEAPLANGIVDYFNALRFQRIVGPTKAAAELEADKFLGYDVNDVAGVPQAKGMRCYTLEEVLRAIPLMATERGVVLKGRGLYEGKGVTVYDSQDQAIKDAAQFFENFGIKDKLREGVLVSERLFGQEYSVYAQSDGKMGVMFNIGVQDHKRRDNGDSGPNTGGMGAYCPVPIVTPEVLRMSQDMINRAVMEMDKRRRPFSGTLYGGMILTEDGQKSIEWNVRFGDPETQPLMMQLESDLYEHFSNSLDGKLNASDIRFKPGGACGVVLASQGYPGSYKKGLRIVGLEEAGAIPGIKVFHAGTALKDGNIVTSGGRVLCVTGQSELGLSQAIGKAYKAVDKFYLLDDSSITVGFQHRYDVGAKALRKS